MVWNARPRIQSYHVMWLFVVLFVVAFLWFANHLVNLGSRIWGPLPR